MCAPGLDDSQHLFDRDSLEFVHCHHLYHQFLQPQRDLDVWGEIDGFLHPVYEDDNVVGLLPGIEVVEHFVEDYSQTPDIALYCVGIADDDLWGHIDGGAD